MSPGVPFTSALPAMVAHEASAAHGDAERLGAMIEALSRALGFTVALAARGDGPMIDTMLAGADGYAHAEAVEKAPFARMMTGTLRR